MKLDPSYRANANEQLALIGFLMSDHLTLTSPPTDRFNVTSSNVTTCPAVLDSGCLLAHAMLGELRDAKMFEEIFFQFVGHTSVFLVRCPSLSILIPCALTFPLLGHLSLLPPSGTSCLSPGSSVGESHPPSNLFWDVEIKSDPHQVKEYLFWDVEISNL